MRLKLYVHAGKEHAWEVGEKAGLTGEALRMFLYAGYEHEIEYEVAPDGKATPVTIDGRRIEER